MNKKNSVQNLALALFLALISGTLKICIKKNDEKVRKSLKKNQHSKPRSRSVSRSYFRNIEDLYKKKDEKVRKSLKKKISVQTLALALFLALISGTLKICIKKKMKK